MKPPVSLAPATRKRYDDLKKVVRESIGAGRKLWAALKAIKEEKLYLHEYKTWEDFCRDQHDFSPQHANRLIAAFEIVKSLPRESEPVGSLLNEAQARELAKVPEENRAEILAEASKSGAVTASSIADTANQASSQLTELTAKPKPILDELGTEIPDECLVYWRRRDEIQKLLTDLSRIKCAVEKAKHDEDPLFAKISNGILNSFTLAYNQLLEAKPYAVCTKCQGRF